MAESQKYLSLEEVADLLGVNYQLVYRLVRSGELPAIRLGRVYRIDRADLDVYLQNSKTTIELVCASCGKTYASHLSLPHGCAECDAPICIDCWERNDVRGCREHNPAPNP